MSPPAPSGIGSSASGVRQFYTPERTHNARRFYLPVARDLCVGAPGRKFMMGGVGLGSAVAALEMATERPLLWATAQYLSFSPPDSIVDIDIHIPVIGKSVTQARAVSHLGEREIIAVSAALGSRPSEDNEQYTRMPDVPRADELPTEPNEFADPGDLFSRIERRRVPDEAADREGRARMWTRTIEDEPITAGLLAVFADFLPGAIPLTRRSTSLDNTLRIVSLAPTRWCLLDSTIHVLASGFFHGEMRIFAESGQLLAVASQSGALPRRG